MDATRHLELLRIEGDRLASVPVDALGAPVPSLPDWTVERVLRHTGKVHRWVTGALAAGPDGDLGGDVAGLPTGPDCLPAYREALDGVLAELARHDPDEAAATFTGPGSAAFWYRRQAHEVAVHRVDAADAVHAAGGPAPEALEVDGAADAIDEWATLFLAVRYAQRFGPFPDDLRGRRVHVHGTDDPAPTDGAEWLLTFTPEGTVDVATTHAKGDVALRGPAEDLLLALWRRRPLSTIDAIGDVAVAERLLEIATF
ncbi:maleylpyruvate isomerase N-terminal domain-containing protein [Aquihabitans sp. G128]|uniref:maleylpyruvate isomerase N-terminal domain-containing protein n=1 Tax=Aquihabitans sp. G128 TaxID=2849779 RepID=UPI001C24E629|nr:maleylpyruvate isomerase N-terminal domain-containing protein [Aquihabitans sp. G128]QXC60022.1 maleylpyruvate isomerase N-terminal domain-containing protein [Aquihabitans sp. G128]